MSHTSAWEAVEAAKALGIQLRLEGNHVHARLPQGDQDRFSKILDQLRANRESVAAVLRQRTMAPPMPAHVRLVRWDPKEAPIAIESCSVVVDVSLFIGSTLKQLGVALADRKRWTGWTVPQLVDRLRQAGVVVEVDQPDVAGRS
jgi:hypothetical protein